MNIFNTPRGFRPHNGPTAPYKPYIQLDLSVNGHEKFLQVHCNEQGVKLKFIGSRLKADEWYISTPVFLTCLQAEENITMTFASGQISVQPLAQHKVFNCRFTVKKAEYFQELVISHTNISKIIKFLESDAWKTF